MADVTVFIFTLVLFAVCLAYIRGCRLLKGSRP
jgi:hypothetical protein